MGLDPEKAQAMCALAVQNNHNATLRRLQAAGAKVKEVVTELAGGVQETVGEAVDHVSSLFNGTSSDTPITDHLETGDLVQRYLEADPATLNGKDHYIQERLLSFGDRYPDLVETHHYGAMLYGELHAAAREFDRMAGNAEKGFREFGGISFEKG